MTYQATALWAPALFTILYQLSFFFVAYFNRFDKVTDFAGSSNFLINALISLFVGAGANGANQIESKQWVVFGCVAIWAVRLAAFLLARVLKAGDDKRFDEMREKFFAFLGFWIFQMLWVYIVGLSYLLLNAYQVPVGTTSDDLTFGRSPRDWAGLVMFIVGFLIEAVSDQQKFYFRFNATAVAGSEGTRPILRKGVWAWSRQPNYFGEIFLWWGLFVLCLNPTSDPSGTTYVSILSPIFITLLLLFLSGIPLSEQNSQKRYLDPAKSTPEARRMYLEYRNETSPLIPVPRVIYRNLPLWIKRVFFFEWTRYESDFFKQAIQEMRQSGQQAA